MNQKNVIAILGVVVVGLIGTTVYFATINKANSPVAQTQPSTVTADSCHPTGCSNQICSDTDVVSTCEYLPKYACYKTATCARQSDGKCAWTQTPALKKCIETALKDTQTQQVANQQPTTPVNTSKIYSSQKYGFEFQYPSELMITSRSNENQVIIADEDGGHWIHEVKIENNSDKLTLEKILAKEDVSIKKIVSDIIIDGVPAKRYSIINKGDYGNANVILVVKNNILTIHGDDATTLNKALFEVLYSTFKFTK